MYAVRDPHLLEAADVLRQLEVEEAKGLSPSEVKKRVARFGPNALRQAKSVSILSLFVRQFRSAVVVLLGAAAVAALIFRDVPEAIAIGAVILISTLIGFFTESSAVRSLEALQPPGHATARVRRGGELVQSDASGLVPGDVVELEGGDIFSADMRLVEAAKLSADESALTGESAPVSKSIATMTRETPLAERCNMAYKGRA